MKICVHLLRTATTANVKRNAHPNPNSNPDFNPYPTPNQNPIITLTLALSCQKYHWRSSNFVAGANVESPNLYKHNIKCYINLSGLLNNSGL